MLLTDVDVPVLQDPFLALYGDADVENMSDGWDDSVYGFVHTVEIPDGLGRSAHSGTRRATRGLYLAATVEGLRLTEILKGRMEREAVRAPDPTRRRTPAFRRRRYQLSRYRAHLHAHPCPQGVGQSAWNRKRSEPHTATNASLQQSLCAMNYLRAQYKVPLPADCPTTTLAQTSSLSPSPSPSSSHQVLFKYLRKDAELGDPIRFRPTMDHMNCKCSTRETRTQTESRVLTRFGRRSSGAPNILGRMESTARLCPTLAPPPARAATGLDCIPS